MNIYITGISGTGKTRVAEELRSRGYVVVNEDFVNCHDILDPYMRQYCFYTEYHRLRAVKGIHSNHLLAVHAYTNALRESDPRLNELFKLWNVHIHYLMKRDFIIVLYLREELIRRRSDPSLHPTVHMIAQQYMVRLSREYSLLLVSVENGIEAVVDIVEAYVKSISNTETEAGYNSSTRKQFTWELM